MRGVIDRQQTNNLTNKLMVVFCWVAHHTRRAYIVGTRLNADIESRTAYMFIHTFKCAAMKNMEQEVFGSPCALTHGTQDYIRENVCFCLLRIFILNARHRIADSMVHKIEKFQKRNYTGGGGGAAVSNTYIERTIKYLFIVYICMYVYERKTNKSDVV